jgi:hypothetical protein
LPKLPILSSPLLAMQQAAAVLGVL